MSLEYIRSKYKVPAFLDSVVKYTKYTKLGTGEIIEGKIIGTVGHYLKVKSDKIERNLILHPTWHIEYLKEE